MSIVRWAGDIKSTGTRISFLALTIGLQRDGGKLQKDGFNEQLQILLSEEVFWQSKWSALSALSGWISLLRNSVSCSVRSLQLSSAVFISSLFSLKWISLLDKCSLQLCSTICKSSVWDFPRIDFGDPPPSKLNKTIYWSFTANF